MKWLEVFTKVAKETERGIGIGIGRSGFTAGGANLGYHFSSIGNSFAIRLLSTVHHGAPKTVFHF